MNFSITEEQRQLADSLQRLLAEANNFDSRRKRLGQPKPDRLALWPRFAELGLIAAAFDEAHEGFAGDPRTMAVVLAALGASLAVEPYLASAVVAGRILQHAVDAHARELIRASIAGSAICVLAHDAGADPFAAPGVAASAGAGHVALSGRLRCIRHADVAGSFLVPAALNGATVIYHVPRDADGLSIECYRLIDAAGAGDLELHSVSVPDARALSFAGPAHDVLHDALEWGVVGLCAEAAGIIDALNRATFAYLSTRKQFGAALASFQALQHRAADMFIAAEEVAAAVNYAIEALASPPAAQRSAAICAAKVVADVSGRRVGHEAVQMHGGMGVSDELNVSHFARRLTAIRSELGGVDTHRRRYAGCQERGAAIAAVAP